MAQMFSLQVICDFFSIFLISEDKTLFFYLIWLCSKDMSSFYDLDADSAAQRVIYGVDCTEFGSRIIKHGALGHLRLQVRNKKSFATRKDHSLQRV